MLCSKCATQNPDNETSCVSCGALLTDAEPLAESPKAPKKRKTLRWLIAGVVVVVAAVLVLVFTGAFGDGIHSDPESAALAFVENYYALHYDAMCETVYPAMLNEEFEETFSQVMTEMEQTDFTVSQFTVTDTQKADSADCAEWTELLNEGYGASAEAEQVCYVTVEYLFSGSVGEEVYEDLPAGTIVAVAKIDGAWYVVNGNESATYGYNSPEEAALVYFEAYCDLDYDTMSTALYPDIDTEQTRAGFEELAALMAETENCAYSNFAVTDKELRGSGDIDLWTQRLKDEYGFDAVISELCYVSVTYDYVGTYDGEYFDETITNLIPVAEVDGIWYVIDGVVW